MTEYNPGGTTAYLYSSYLGGASTSTGQGIGVDGSAGNIAVAGETKSTNFPTTNPIQSHLAGSAQGDAFVDRTEPQRRHQLQLPVFDLPGRQRLLRRTPPSVWPWTPSGQRLRRR